MKAANDLSGRLGAVDLASFGQTAIVTTGYQTTGIIDVASFAAFVQRLMAEDDLSSGEKMWTKALVHAPLRFQRIHRRRVVLGAIGDWPAAPLRFRDHRR